ncbi:polyprenyl synthetase family protein [bacterium]|nr:polyprenyl synthetase family protein [bacterium]
MSVGNGILSEIIPELYSGMRSEFFSSDPDVDVILEQVFSIHGKGTRPALMAHAASLAGGSRESLYRAAMVIEAIHVASLHHDDVLDGSGLRRGMETLNARYSDKVSVLSGDYIFIRALMMSHEIDAPGAVSVVINSVERMIRGEIRDSLASGIIDEETYLSIVGDKTASLFAASGELGVMLSGASGIERVWGRELGECVGTAFQIVDDTLDYMGDVDVMGKPGLMDVMAGRMTLPLIYTLRDFKQEKIKKLLFGSEKTVKELLSLVRSNGGIEYAVQRARDYADKARDISLRFENRKAQDELSDFLAALIDRRF